MSIKRKVIVSREFSILSYWQSASNCWAFASERKERCFQRPSVSLYLTRFSL